MKTAISDNPNVLSAAISEPSDNPNPSRAVALIAAAALFAIACLLYRSSLMPSLRNWRVQLAEYLFILSASVAVFTACTNFAKELRLVRVLGFPCLIAAYAAFLFCSVYKLDMYQFGGYDEGMLVNFATYYAQGFRPYLDFFSCMPPLLLAGIRATVLFLGMRWSNLALLTACFAALTCLWIFYLLRRASLAPHWAFAITVCIETCTMFLAPIWWYNNTCSVSVILLLLSVLACLQQRNSLMSWISLSLSMVLVLTSKPNVIPSCLMVIVLLTVRSKTQWLRVGAACFGALVVALAICYAAQTPPLLLLHSYAEIAKLRGSPLLLVPFRQMTHGDRAFQALLTAVVTLCFAGLLIRSATRAGTHWRPLAACAIAALTALEIVCTNSEWEATNLIVMVVPAAFLCLLPWNEEKISPGRSKLLAALLTLFLVMPGFQGLTHLRIRSIGELMFYESLPTQAIREGYFSGLEAGPRFLRIQQQIGKAMTRYPSHRLFFGPRMEFEYAVLHLPVMRNIPLSWSPGNLFSPQRLPEILAEFQRQDPELLIFLKDDYTGMGLVGDYIRTTSSYQRIDDYQDLTVYVRRGQIPVPVGPHQI